MTPLNGKAQAAPEASKRAHDHRSEGPSSEPEGPVKKKQKLKKTILFDEVNAEKKDWRVEDIYMIIEYPAKSDKWYILRCQTCDLICFTVNGASKHLTGKMHSINGKWDRAVEELGIQVVDCGEEKARRNNAALEEAFKQGHQYERKLGHRRRQTSIGSCHQKPTTSHGRQDGEGNMPKDKADSEDSEYVPSDEEGYALVPEDERQIEPVLGVVEPVAGELYQAYWEESKTWYLTTVLPLRELDEIGITGNLRSLNLVHTIPPCYEVDRNGLDIIGWKDSFEGSGTRVSEREFPCLFFHENFQVPPIGEFAPPGGRHYAWVSARDLRYTDYRQPGGHKVETHGRIAAVNFRRRLVAMRALRHAAQPEADMVGQVSCPVPRNQGRDHAASSETSTIDTTIFVQPNLRGGSSPLRSLEPDKPTGQAQRPASVQPRQGPTALKTPPPHPRQGENL